MFGAENVACYTSIVHKRPRLGTRGLNGVTMIVAMERKLISELIEEYKTCTCLWRIKDPDYKNKEMKNEAYESLLQLIKKYIIMAIIIIIMNNVTLGTIIIIITIYNIAGTKKNTRWSIAERDRSSATSVCCRPRWAGHELEGKCVCGRGRARFSAAAADDL